jgi:methionyl-tRNA formyltransferase
MTKTSKKILFFGNERLATGVSTDAPTLRTLINAGYEICAVVLNNDKVVSRKSRALEVAEVAKQHNIPVIFPDKLQDEVETLAAYQADVGVLVAFGKIIPQEVIDIFPAGIVNIHPSLLPKHRGPTPIESVILAGETETGVSLMRLVREMDAGPVYAQRTIPVPGKISKQALCDELSKIGSEMLVQCLPSIIDGSLEPLEQDDSIATYDSLINKADGVLDWTKPATMLEREIRAYASWPRSRGIIGNHQVIITEADVEKTSGEAGDYVISGDNLIVHCGVDSLKIRRLQPENKKEMPVEAFLKGYPL